MTKNRRGEDPHKPPRCIGTPPPHLRDPIVCRQSVGKFVWESATLGKPMKGRRAEQEMAHVPPKYLGVALALASFANRDGSNARPGKALGPASGLGDTIPKLVRAWLEEFGFITVQTVRDDDGQIRELRGGRDKMGREYSTVYRLTVPAPLAASLGLWEGGPHWMERPATWPIHRKLSATTPTGQTGQSSADLGHKTRDLGHKTADLGHNARPLPRSTSPFRANSTTSLATANDGAATKTKIKTPDYPDELERIVEAVEEELEHPLDAPDRACAEDMACRGCHPKFIARTIRRRAES